MVISLSDAFALVIQGPIGFYVSSPDTWVRYAWHMGEERSSSDTKLQPVSFAVSGAV